MEHFANIIFVISNFCVLYFMKKDHEFFQYMSKFKFIMKMITAFDSFKVYDPEYIPVVVLNN